MKLKSLLLIFVLKGLPAMSFHLDDQPKNRYNIRAGVFVNSGRESYLQMSFVRNTFSYFDNNAYHPAAIIGLGLDNKAGYDFRYNQPVWGLKGAFEFNQLFIDPDFMIKYAVGVHAMERVASFAHNLNLGYIFNKRNDRLKIINYSFEHRVNNNRNMFLHELGIVFWLN